MRIINKNLWRLSNAMQFDDIYQEAYLKFLTLRKKYAGVIDSPKHFMSLYKTALARKITDFSHESTKLRKQVVFTDLEDNFGEETMDYSDLLIGETDMEGLLEIKLDEAPPDVRMVLNIMINSRPDLLEAIHDSWFDNGKRKPGGNQFLCSLVGYDHREVDLVARVTDYLENDEDE